LIDLRREAVACLGDFVGLTPTILTGFPPNATIQLTRLDPAGRLAAFALSDGTLLLRELPSGREAARLKMERTPRSLCFSPAGEQLVAVQPSDPAQICAWSRSAGGGWGEVEKQPLPGAQACLFYEDGLFAAVRDGATRSGKLVKVGSGEVLLSFESPEDRFPEVALSPDGRWLAIERVVEAERRTSVIDVWNLKTRRLRQTLAPDLGFFETINFSPDGRFLSGLSGLGVAVFQTSTFERITQFKDYFQFPTQPAFAGTLMALAYFQQRRVHLWDWVRNQEMATLVLPGTVYETAFAPDGSYLLTSGPRSARLYPMDLKAEKLNLAGHVGGVTAVEFSPDGARLASIGKDRAMRIWDTATGRELWGAETLPAPGQSVAYNSAGALLATSDFETQLVWVWDARRGKRLLELGSSKNNNQTWSVQFSPDSRYLATAATGKNSAGLDIWKLDCRVAGEEFSVKAELVKSLNGKFWNLAFAPDGKRLAFIDGSGSRAVDTWELEGTAPPRLVWTNLWGRSGVAVQTLAFTPDSRSLLTVGRNRELVGLDAFTGRELFSFPTRDAKAGGQSSAVTNFRLDPGGTKLAMASASGLGVDLWELHSGKLLYSLPDENGTVYWLAWSPDSRRLAIARSNGEVSIWNLTEVERTLVQLGLSPEALIQARDPSAIPHSNHN
jgi:WD40 repeat protein